MYKVEYTDEEANAQLQLNDLAVKAGGLNVAEAAIVLTKKLQNSKVNDNGPTDTTI